MLTAARTDRCASWQSAPAPASRTLRGHVHESDIHAPGYACRGDDLRREAEKFGEVRDVYIPKDFHTKRPKGLAFIEFQDATACEDACDGMEGLELEGQPVLSVITPAVACSSAHAMTRMAATVPA
jgi:hypothetical protein